MMDTANTEKLCKVMEDVMNFDEFQIDAQSTPLLETEEVVKTIHGIAHDLITADEVMKIVGGPACASYVTGVNFGLLVGWIFAQRGGELYDA